MLQSIRLTPRRALAAAALIGALAVGGAHAQQAPGLAATPAQQPVGEAAKVKKVLEQKFPGATVSNVTKTS